MLHCTAQGEDQRALQVLEDAEKLVKDIEEEKTEELDQRQVMQ
jgi:hypothetical protein